MDFDAVYKAFCTLADLDQSEAAGWVFLVHECVDDISSIINQERNITREQRRKLNGLAAAKALWQYRKILSARGSLSGVRAGDVTFNDDSSSVDAAYLLYCEKLAECAEIVNSGDFVFGRTDIFCTDQI